MLEIPLVGEDGNGHTVKCVLGVPPQPEGHGLRAESSRAASAGVENGTGNEFRTGGIRAGLAVGLDRVPVEAGGGVASGYCCAPCVRGDSQG